MIVVTGILVLLIFVATTQQTSLRQFIKQFSPAKEDPRIAKTSSQTKPPTATNVAAFLESQTQQQTRQQILMKLLVEAAEDIQQLRLSTPKGQNAVEKYLEILQADPQNQDAQQGLNTVVDKYLALAQKTQDTQRYSIAANFLSKAKSILPYHPALQQAEENLRMAKLAHQRELRRLADIEKQRQAEPQAKSRQTDPYTGMQFVSIDPGCFQMGSQSNAGRSTPVHSVCLTRGYYLGKYEVTQAQWQKVMNDTPSRFKGNNKPVENVSWDEVQNFIRTLNRKTGREYRLPTEAEWEYACRSGGQDQKYCGSNTIDNVAWYVENSEGTTHPVGQKEPNGLGLYDMSGNVWEWVQDWFERHYYSKSPTNDPKGPSSSAFRVIRGGSWKDPNRVCRSADRYGDDPSDDGDLGFRLARPR